MRELDRRDFTFRAVERGAAPPEAAADVASRFLAGAHSVRVGRVNDSTGTPAVLESAFAEPPEGSPIEEARRHVHDVAPALGLDDPGQAEFVPDWQPIVTSGRTKVVHLQQYFRGVPFFEMTRTVHLAPDGSVERVLGDNAPGFGEPDTEPTLPAAEAVRVAIAYLAGAEDDEAARDHHGQAVRRPWRLDTDAEPEPTRSFPLPSRPGQFRVAGLDEAVSTQLVLFYMNPEVQLGWLVTVFLPRLAGDYDLIVAANGVREGELLYCKDTLGSVAATGEVFRNNPDEAGRVSIAFPPQGDALLDALGSQPTDWVSADRAMGNNVSVFRGNTNMSLSGVQGPGGLTFSPADAEGKDQRVLNAFYCCNYMHDVFLALGFGEEDGNFEAVHSGTSSGGGDELEVRIHDRVLGGTARMRARRDGKNPEMTLGLVESSGRHTALDADIVFHEYTHGVTQRLVGGPQNFRSLVQPQSRAMGEGWSDYFALTFQNYSRAAETFAYGVWSSGVPQGIRPRVGSYDQGFNGHFGLLGDPDFEKPHEAGEIWCAALVRMNKLLGARLGDRRKGHILGWQVVVESLKLIAPSPGFLDGRDGILKALDDFHREGALDDATHAGARSDVETAFKAFGMGPAADSNGASFEGIVADFG